MSPSRLGLQRQLAVVVFLSVLLSALTVCGTLFYFSKRRSYADNERQAEQMVQAASLAFSQAVSADDVVLLDALIHELQSHKDLHIEEGYVIDPKGLVLAHSRLGENGKAYPVPALLALKQPPRLSEVLSEGEHTFEVISLLQENGNTLGALSATFSTAFLSKKIESEMFWVVGATVPILALSGLGVMVYGRRLVARLKRLQVKALAIGRGEWREPLTVTGADEITELTGALNEMQADLFQLHEKDRLSAETIADLNRELSAQLIVVQRLKEQLVEENLALREELRTTSAPGEIIGAERSLRHIIDQVAQLASLPVTVLIAGESGTGKELFVRFLHKAGARADGPFIALNCAALPAALIESELFGHEKGAFTGATAQKKGKFEIAHGGTLFLDEVGELPAEAQAKLLRALQEGEITRVGGEQAIPVNVRVVAATNRDLAKEVENGRFRQDLYYRLKVVELHCPPLRARREDIPALAQHFIERYNRKLGKPVVGISPSALKILQAYHWPGNVRELENMVARAVALATTQVLGPDDFLPLTQVAPTPAAHLTDSATSLSAFDGLLKLCSLSPSDLKGNAWGNIQAACERICLREALNRSRNQMGAARILGLTTTKLHRLIRKHKLKHDENSA